MNSENGYYIGGKRMFFFTHLFISKALYQHFSTKCKLDKMAFYYGNIKPDLPAEYSCHHTLENCIFTTYNTSNWLMNEEVSFKELSVALGEICHYTCDFFCLYHLNEKVHNKKLKHFLYELRLHIEMFKRYPNRQYIILSSRREPRKDITSIILEMRKAYLQQPEGMKYDLEYALTTVTWICESILFNINNPSIDQSHNNNMPATIYKI